MARAEQYGRLPLFYVGFAHLCLLTAGALVALEPDAYVGFFYHPKMIGVVHLVTLGWVSSSILGALYMILPMALRSRMPAGRADTWFFWIYSIGVAGMVSHFWIDELSGMLYAAAMVLGGFVFVGARVSAALRRSKIPTVVKVHFRLAFVQIVVAGTFGVLLAFNKITPFLPGTVMTNVYAHAHLAALGWVVMTIMGAGYRLLPMLLPSAVPEGRRLVVTLLLLEGSVVGLFVSLIARVEWRGVFAVGAALALLSFFGTVLWMRRHGRPPARHLPRPDLGLLHVGLAFLYLVFAIGLGLFLAFGGEGESLYRWAPVYGVVGLLGFFSQLIFGVNLRQLPVFAWLRASRSGVPDESSSSFLTPGLSRLASGCWLVGIPVLGLALWLESTALLRGGALVFVAASILGLTILRSVTARAQSAVTGS